MFVGRIDVRTKGLDLLVEAFADAVSEEPGAATLTLVGPDWRDGVGPLRSLAAARGIAQLVAIRDRIPGSEVPALLEQCDVYVQLSRNESSPLSVNDALALGKPVILSNRVGTASCPEIAGLPHVKIIAPVVSEASLAISKTLEDLPSLQRAACSVNPELREFLSWRRAARLHLDGYELLLSADEWA